MVIANDTKGSRSLGLSSERVFRSYYGRTYFEGPGKLVLEAITSISIGSLTVLPLGSWTLPVTLK
jgi:hypothetical protein